MNNNNAYDIEFWLFHHWKENILNNDGDNKIICFPQRGEAMIEQEHHASADIKEKLLELEQRWQHLMDRCAWKQDHLQQAYKVGIQFPIIVYLQCTIGRRMQMDGQPAILHF